MALNSITMAADNYNLEAGDKSWFETTVDGATAVAGATVNSAINSVGFIGNAISNALPGEDTEFESKDTYDFLRGSWGFEDAAAFYEEHRQGVDAAALLAGSLVPGMVGIKALHLAGKSEKLVNTLGFRLSGLENARKVAKQTAGMQDQVYSVLHKNTLKALAAGVEVNLYESAAFEIAALSTTIASPVYDGLDAGDMAWNMAKMAVMGGVIGGGFSAAKTIHGLGKASREAALLRENPETLTKQAAASDRLLSKKFTSGDWSDDLRELTGDDAALTMPLREMVNKQDAVATSNTFGFVKDAKRLGDVKTEVEEFASGVRIESDELHQVVDLKTGNFYPNRKGLPANLGDNIPAKATISFIPRLGEAVIRDEGGKLLRSISIHSKEFVDMSLEEAQVAYVMRAREGLDALVKTGIDSGDIPALEMLIQSGRRDIPINGIASYSDDFARQLLKDAKEVTLGILINEKKFSPEVAQKMLNMPSISKGDKVFATLMKDMEVEALTPRFAALTYDVKDVADDVLFSPWGQGALAHAKAEARLMSETRGVASAGAWNEAGFIGAGSDFMGEQEVKAMLNDFTTKSQAAGISSFADADYGTGWSWAINTGKQVKLYAEKWKTRVMDALNPHMLKIKNSPELADELIKVVNQYRLTDQHYVMLPQRPGFLVRFDEAVRLTGNKIGIKEHIDARKNPLVIPISEDLEAFLQVHSKENLQYRKVSSKVATGRGGWDVKAHEKYPDLIPFYAPTLNTVKYPHFYLVRQADDVIGSGSHVSVIVARDASKLAEKRALFEQQVLADEGATGLSRYQFITKGESKEYHEALNDYSYARGLNDSRVDNALRRAGVLGEEKPLLESQVPGAIDDMLDDFTSFHARMAARSVRDIVESQYLEVFTQLRELGSTLLELEGSKTRNITKAALESTKNPFMDVIKTALDVSTFQEYRPWATANEWLEQTGSKAFYSIKRSAQDFFDRRAAGKMTESEIDAGLAEIEATANRVGAPSPFKPAAEEIFRDQLAQNPVMGRLISRGNALVSAYALGLDAINAVNVAIGTFVNQNAEFTSIIRAIKNSNAAKAGKLTQIDLTDVHLPGDLSSGFAIQGVTKLNAAVIKRFWQGGEIWVPASDPLKETAGYWKKVSGKELLDEYTKEGLSVIELQQYRQMVDNLALSGAEGAAELNHKFINALESFGEKGRKWTGNNFAERFSRFIAAHAMRKLTDVAQAQGIIKSAAEAATYRNTAVNRIQGNMIASQRPVMFQGAAGQAIGLFMTYQVNLMQQLFRHVGDGDRVAAGMMMATQTALYGMQGLPGWNFINAHIIANASGNTTHADAYSTVNNLAGKEVADWVLYGAGSNALGLFSPELKFNLYTRGDINPRTLTIIPAAIDETILYNATVKFAGNIANMTQNLANGAPANQVLWQGLQHQGLNRPLAGLGAIMAGGTYTSDGKLIAPTEEGFPLFVAANYVRLAGAKPLDTAIAADALFRTRGFDAADRERMKKLSTAMRLEAADGTIDPDKWEDFAGEYAKNGGNPENFRSFAINKLKDQEQGIVERSIDRMKSSTMQNYMSVIGGNEPDFEFERRSIAPETTSPQF